jgi:hypothetical protein
VDRSLVVVDEGIGEARYRLLETIRQYAREKLFEAGEAERARNRHLDCYVTWVESAEPRLLGAEMIAALDQLEIEQDNLRAALEWALESDPLAALRMMAVLYTFWVRRASLTEGLNWVRAALRRAEAASQLQGEAEQLYLATRAKALGGEATLALGLGYNPAALAAVEASVSLARRINAYQTLAMALGLGATVCGFLGDIATARLWAEECLALSRERGYAYELGIFSGVQMFLAVVANEPMHVGIQEETLQAARASGNPWAIALAIRNIAAAAAVSGKWAEAYAGFEEASTLFQQMRDWLFYNSSRSETGHILRKQGRYDEAALVYGETIRAFQELGQFAAVAHELESFAFIAIAQSQVQRAARLLGAAESLRERINTPMTALERSEYDQHVAALQAQMDEPAFAAAWAEGRALTMEQAVDYALQEMNA